MFIARNQLIHFNLILFLYFLHFLSFPFAVAILVPSYHLLIRCFYLHESSDLIKQFSEILDSVIHEITFLIHSSVQLGETGNHKLLNRIPDKGSHLKI